MTQVRPDPMRLCMCAWCGQKKIPALMRYPGVLKGRVPSTCFSCREAHPGMSWCEYHAEPHPTDRFRPAGKGRNGLWIICREAGNYRIAAQRGRPPITCDACGTERSSWFFRGGRAKSAVCRVCEDSRPGERWCTGCKDWLSEESFARNGVDGKWFAARCRPCYSANAHGTTVAEILRIQGSVVPQCAACGSRDDLKVDHDHSCCPGPTSCGMCIRGYLCHECNTAEGLLRTSLRARRLARYMDRCAKAKRPGGIPSRPDARSSTIDAMRLAHPVQRALW
jgi:hypothetical protein